MLQAGGHLLYGRLIPERVAGPGLVAGRLEPTGHPGILAGADSTLLLAMGEGKKSPQQAK